MQESLGAGKRPQKEGKGSQPRYEAAPEETDPGPSGEVRQVPGPPIRVRRELDASGDRTRGSQDRAHPHGLPEQTGFSQAGNQQDGPRRFRNHAHTAVPLRRKEWVASEVLRVVESFNGTNSPICLTAGRNIPTKTQIVSAWCGLYGKGVTGHSARRSGALGYIRAGWTITQTAYLGRWKSSSILTYAEEALETMPANLGGPNVARFESRKEDKTNPSEIDVVEYTTWKEMVNKELKAIKRDNENQSTELAETMEFWKHIAKTQEGKLPSKVACRSTGVIHHNAAKVAASPPFTWRSLCGWAYYGGNFMFESETTTPTCTKCLNLHATQRGGVGTS